MGWCTAGTSGQSCDFKSCDQLHGEWHEAGPGGCLVLSLLRDPVAKTAIRSLVYPPILQVRDEVLPRSRVGSVIVDDFSRHYDEAVNILSQDADLLNEVIDFLITNVPFARALTGEKVGAPGPGDGWTPSAYIAERLRPGTVDWFGQILERFRGHASDELVASIDHYQRLVPMLLDLTPIEILTQLRDSRLLEVMHAG
jgi:hypothetical protein